MTYEVVVSEATTETFKHIRAQIENNWGIKYGQKFEKRVAHVLDIISLSPFISKAIPLI